MIWLKDRLVSLIDLESLPFLSELSVSLPIILITLIARHYDFFVAVVIDYLLIYPLLKVGLKKKRK